jgi:hypothetical protein
MINIQDYVNADRTGKAGLRMATIASGSSTLSIPPDRHSAPSFSQSDAGKNIVVIGAGADGGNLYTTIAMVTSLTEVELAAPASTTVGVSPVPSPTFAFLNAKKSIVRGTTQ